MGLTSRDGVAMNLVTPTSVVPNRLDGAVHIKDRIIERLAIVKRLQIGEVGLVSLHQVSQLENGFKLKLRFGHERKKKVLY